MVGHRGPHRLQHLLSRAVWDDQQVLDAAAAGLLPSSMTGTRYWSWTRPPMVQEVAAVFGDAEEVHPGAVGAAGPAGGLAVHG